MVRNHYKLMTANMVDPMFQNIRTLKDRVGYILQKFPDTRNNDELLIHRVCDEFHYNPISKASAIERSRRWYNQRKEYLPTDWNIAKKRGIAEEIWREALGYKGFLF